MKGGTKLSKVMANKLSPGTTSAQDRSGLETAVPSDRDNSIISPAGTAPDGANTELEWTQDGGRRRRRRRRRTGGKKKSRKGNKSRCRTKKRRGGKRRTRRR